jgi:hypothetical protein
VRLSKPQATAGRSERTLHEALVRVDVRGEEVGEVLDAGELTGDELLHESRESIFAASGHDHIALSRAEAQVDVARGALLLVVFGHESDRLPVLGGDLLRPVLVDRVVVAGFEGGLVAECDLVLTEVAFALGPFDEEPSPSHRIANVAQERFDSGGAEEGVVDVVLVRRRDLGVLRGEGLLVARVEGDELEFGADMGRSNHARQGGRAGV